MIRHVSRIAEIVDDVDTAAQFYREVLGLPVDHQPGGSYSVVKVPGVLHFGLWSRAAAAEATFGDRNAVERIPLGFAVEFEVDSVGPAADAIGERGWQIAQAPKKEPWGQALSRFFLPSGMLGRHLRDAVGAPPQPGAAGRGRGCDDHLNGEGWGSRGKQYGQDASATKSRAGNLAK